MIRKAEAFVIATLWTVLSSPIARAQSPGSFTLTGNMTTPRSSHTATLLPDGRVLIAGGGSNTLELYDPAIGTFTAPGATTASGVGTATLLPDGRVLLVEGQAAELYDPSDGSLTSTGSMLEAQTFYSATLLQNGKVLFTGGMSGWTDCCPIAVNPELYDPSTQTFSFPGSYANTGADPTWGGSGLVAVAATLLADGRVLVATEAQAELYDPVTNTFSLAGAMASSCGNYGPPLYISGRTATLLPSGRVFLSGGENEDCGLFGDELYDSLSGFTLNSGPGLTFQTATLIPDGTTLIAGGEVFGYGWFASTLASLYNPSTGFLTVPSMNAGRFFHQATLLKDGRVLITGGEERVGSELAVTSLSSAEIYTPQVLVPAPALLSLSGDGKGQGVIKHAGTDRIASAADPAGPGEILSIYLTGLADGSVIPPQVAIGGKSAKITLFENVPGNPGLNVVNVQVPDGVAPGPAVRVRLTYIGRLSNEVTIGATASPCTYSLTASSASLGPGPSSGTVGVIAGAGCTWTVLNSQPGWLTINSGSSGSGTGTVSYSLSANSSFTSRSVTLTIAGLPFTATQAAADSVVSAQSVTPSSGSGDGSGQPFVFTFSDGKGAGDLQTVWEWFTPAFNSVSAAGTCMVYFNQSNNTINLLNDAGTAWAAQTVGTAGVLQNSQCQVNVGATSVAPNGNNLVWTLPVTFKPAFAGAQQVWMYGGGSTANSGWQHMGAWTVAAPGQPPAGVSAQSVTPSSGSGDGSGQPFVFTFSDSKGAGDLQTVWEWFTPAFNSVSAAGTCMVYFNQSNNTINLLNDAGTAWAAQTVGTAGVLQNSQCQVNVGATSVAPNGNNLVWALPVTFKPAFAGAQQVWMYGGGSTANSGWQHMGAWTVAAPGQPPAGVSAQSVTPSSGSGDGSGQPFVFTFSDGKGAGDLQTVWEWFTPAFNSVSAAGTCMVYFNQSNNTINLLNDAGTAWAAQTVGTAGVLQNSQCQVNVGATSVAPNGNNLVWALPVTFKPAFAGAQQVWMYGGGSTANSGWQHMGAWTVAAPGQPPAGVSAQSVTPSSGSGDGSGQPFVFTFSDGKGAGDLQTVWEWFTPAFNSVSAAGTCMVYFNQSNNTINLLNDAGTAWAAQTVGTAGVLQNSQCQVNVGATSVAPNGNNLVWTLPVTFKAGFAGAQQVWMYGGGSTANSGWQQVGAWTI